MPKGPQGQKRPADVIGCAVQAARLSVGLVTEELREPSGRVRSGQAGAKARVKSTTAEERAVIGHLAAQARWRKQA